MFIYFDSDGILINLMQSANFCKLSLKAGTQFNSEELAETTHCVQQVYPNGGNVIFRFATEHDRDVAFERILNAANRYTELLLQRTPQLQKVVAVPSKIS